ncbi:MAG TPA: metallophosphoesterase [Candidatus Acidoferrales bacterium]|jgi:predicted MPP superfamily phosphohydrolase|nr:metallophosphoesterase [Candidatus Acidoferrales bacterium]
MLHSAAIFLAFLGAVAGLSLAFLSQRYWFARAWRFAGRATTPAWRKAIRGALIGALLVIAFAALAAATRNMRGAISRGSWWSAFFGLWLTSSIVSYLFIKIVAGAEWLWRRVQRSASDNSMVPVAPPAPAMGAAHSEKIDHSRRYFFQAAGVIAGAVPFVSAAYGFTEERFRFYVREVQIPIANLPPALDGLRITQLSDIHIGSYMPAAQVRRAVGMANEIGGDLAVVTGDFLTGRSDPLEDCIAELSRLRAPLGVWGCNGNHEIYAKAEEKSAELFQKYGMKLLRQENVELRWQGSAFNLLGVDYQRQRDTEGNRPPMLVGMGTLVRRDVPNILLSHNPNSFPRAAELGIELSLAGHTHGGQVRVEILDHRWSPAEFLTPYVAGLYRRPLFAPANLNDAEVSSVGHLAISQSQSASAIYVNRGLGTIGAPIRLGVPPEITRITLRRAV